MIEHWDKVVASAGWIPYREPFFFKIFGDKVFFSAIPDTSTGLIPTPLKMSSGEQHALFKEMRRVSSNIYIADLNNEWVVDGYKTIPMEYQVIETSKLKLEKDTRNQIHQAERFGVTVVPTGHLSSYEPIVQETAERQNRDPLSQWKLEHMWKHCRFLFASYEGKVIAGCIYAQVDEGLYLLHSASMKMFQSVRPNHAIMNRLIQIAGGRKLWLGNAPKELEGLRKFKESFGAKLLTFPLKYYEL